MVTGPNVLQLKVDCICRHLEADYKDGSCVPSMELYRPYDPKDGAYVAVETLAWEFDHARRKDVPEWYREEFVRS